MTQRLNKILGKFQRTADSLRNLQAENEKANAAEQTAIASLEKQITQRHQTMTDRNAESSIASHVARKIEELISI